MNVQNELSKTIQEFQSLELTKMHLESLSDRLLDAYDQLDELHDVLEKEYNDVQILEQLSMKKLFQKILGNQQKQLEKERQEYLEAALKYNEFKKTVEILEYEKDILDRKAANYNLVKSKLNVLIRQREKELLLIEGSAQRQLKSINNVIDTNLRMKRELHEAIAMGLKAMEILKKMEYQLKNATKWGDWNSIDHSEDLRDIGIDNATKLSYQAKELLIQFEKELEDVFQKKEMSWTYDLDDAKLFTNLYFKNLISDWVIQKKIAASLHHISNFIVKMKKILNALKADLKQTSTSIDYLEDKKRKLILALH